ncbi:MAG TPA: response regulator [Geobacteraceae bacterium]|nr:response regulator [Geobacteraceae bacterium]
MKPDRILIVDDEADIALILKLQLEDAGYSTSRARDGIEALEMLEKDGFSLVLLDIKLPKLDGIGVLERLDPSPRDLAVVMMTAHGSENVAVECMKKGALDYIAKPFSAEDLLNKVERALEFNRNRIEIHRLQRQLEEERKKMEAILRGMADMLVAVDEDGRVISVNRAAEEAFGVPKGSSLGMPVQDLVVADIPPHRLPCRIVLESRTPCLDVTYSVRSHDRFVPVLSSATPLFGASGALIGSMEILRDISHLKALEKEREEFVSMLTHDLKTPLTAVVGSIDLVREGRLGPVNDEQKEYLESAVESCGEMVEMIDTLLDVYRFESGKMVLAFTEEDFGALIRKAAASFRSLAERSGIRLSVAIAENLPAGRMDRNKVVRLFGNLFSNAFKFTSEGGVVEVTAELLDNADGIADRIPPGTYPVEELPRKGAFLMAAVRDTGIGIPRDALGAIFDKFVQAKHRRAGKTKGSGLGLAFCRKVMDAHGGYIWVESEVGKGSTFAVLFPLETREKRTL